MSSPHLHFYDAATPENVPSGVYAAVYVNGFVWPQEEVDRMRGTLGISVEREAFWAKHARILDIENGAADPVDLVPFAKERRRLYGPHDPVIGYVNRSNWDDARERAQHAKENVWWWVSTLDGTTDLECWAVQSQGGMTAPFDLSILKGKNIFHKAHR